MAWEQVMAKAGRDSGVRGMVRTIVWTAVTSGLIPVWMIVLAERGRGVDGPGVWAAAAITLIIGGVATGGVVLGLRRGRRRRD